MNSVARQAQAVKNRIHRSIERELEQCREKMGDEAWRLHGPWVRDYVVASAKEWLKSQALKGAL